MTGVSPNDDGDDAFAVLFLIIARGGSKGVPRKNLQQVGGQSLLGCKAVSARRSRHCARLILSSEDAEIQEEARRLGVEVPFTRPAALASDTASSDDVVLHAMDWIEQHDPRRYDAVMLLEPASPFARADHYDAAVDMLRARNANAVLGVREVDVASVFTGPLGDDGSLSAVAAKVNALTALRRQDQAPEVTMNGALYLMRWDWYRQARSRYADPAGCYGLLMDRVHSLEIEAPIDLALARTLADDGVLDMAHWNMAHWTGEAA